MVWFGFLLYPFFLPPGSYHSQNSSSKYSLEGKGSLTKSDNLKICEMLKSAICKRVKIIQITKSGNLLLVIFGINVGEERAL